MLALVSAVAFITVAGDWPPVNTVREYCGPWTAAIVAPGFDPYLGLRRVTS